SSAITEHLERIETGIGDEGDLDSISGWLREVTDGNRCYLAVEEQVMVTSILLAFPAEIAEHIELRRCPRPRRLPIPKLVDLADGRAIYDESFWRKRPDWTYAPEDDTGDGAMR
ncbi:MAG: NADH-ubiquinone oxidoreductase-F iron-sulfur binding region domain-containing protein, partial [Ilumatobacteraceae bacterium]